MDWRKARELGEAVLVEEALRAFADNPELENEVCLIQTIIEAYEEQRFEELVGKLRAAGWEGLNDAQHAQLQLLARSEKWF